MTHQITVRAARGVLLATVVLSAITSSACSQSSTTPTADEPPTEAAPMSDQSSPAHTNHLIHATSPYLLQHAHNPVNWYEWGKDAFEKAVAEDKPIFLSIGYSACHWCHVMERESFENEEIAAVLNEHFISIKVDREERPDVDEIYMRITQAMNQGRGGWPMSLFLTPDRRPFFAGTYFPARQFKTLLERVVGVWEEKRDDIDEDATQAQRLLSDWAKGVDPSESIASLDVVDKTAQGLARSFDLEKGGYRTGGNKFPPSMAMELMLRVYRRTGNGRLLKAVEATLDPMARGGIYDHLGGGICRYSTDPDWLVPHFEKMLYDQALVSSIYLDAFQVTGTELYASVASDIFDYVIADLQSPGGGFYSTRDADSDGLEGAYYIWTKEQVESVLGEADAKLFCAYYDVTDKGNWFESRGHAPTGPKNILRIKTPPEVFARDHDMTLERFRARLQTWRDALLAERAGRVPPALDDKILTGWNGLMISSLAKGARVLDEPKYAVAAARAADFILSKLRDKEGRLLRTHRAGTSRLKAYASDYAFMIDGLLNLYEATFDRRYLTDAQALSDTLIEHYFDAEKGGFYFTADDAEKLIVRTKDARDGAIPSGNSVAASNFLRLALMLDRKDYRAKAESIFKAFEPIMERSPGAVERMLCAADFYHDRPREIAIIGDPGSAATRALVRTAFEPFLPNKVVMQADTFSDGEALPLLKGKKLVDGRPAAYVCVGYLCKAPVTDPAALAALLATDSTSVSTSTSSSTSTPTPTPTPTRAAPIDETGKK